MFQKANAAICSAVAIALPTLTYAQALPLLEQSEDSVIILAPSVGNAANNIGIERGGICHLEGANHHIPGRRVKIHGAHAFNAKVNPPREYKLYEGLAPSQLVLCHPTKSHESMVSTNKGDRHSNGDSCILIEQLKVISKYRCQASSTICSARVPQDRLCHDGRVAYRYWAWPAWTSIAEYKAAGVRTKWPWKISNDRGPNRTYIAFSETPRTFEVCTQGSVELSADGRSIRLDRGCSLVIGKDIYVESNGTNVSRGTFELID